MTAASGKPVRVLFVCMGNICRSPSAEGVFRRALVKAGLEHAVEVDSAGTHDYHVGHAPDPRACAAASQRGIDIGDLRARRVTAADFNRFDYVLAMDELNLEALAAAAPAGARARLGLLMAYAPSYPQEVPDPYYGGRHGFEIVLDMLEAACAGLLQEIQQARAKV